MIQASRQFSTHKTSNKWTLTKTRSFEHFQISPFPSPHVQCLIKLLIRVERLISEKCQQCKCFIHCPIPQSQWKHLLVSTLTPYIGPNSHVTSHLNSPSKNVLSNYNILQSYNPNSLMSGRLKIHNLNKNITHLLIIKSPPK